MCGIQQGVVGAVGAGFVDDCFVAKPGVQGEDGPAVGDCVFLQQDGRGEGLHGERDVLVVPG